MKSQEFISPQPFVEAEVFWQETNLGADIGVIYRGTENPAFPARGSDQVKQHFDRGGLSCPIGTQKSEHLTALNGKSQVFHCHLAVEFFAQALDLNGKGGVHNFELLVDYQKGVLLVYVMVIYQKRQADEQRLSILVYLS